jgi:translation initiation factor IF-1
MTTNRLMLFRETVAVYCENHTEHTNTLCGQNAVYINPVRTSQETRYVSATKPNRLMLFRETVAVYCENHTEHINTLCGQNAELMNCNIWSIMAIMCTICFNIREKPCVFPPTVITYFIWFSEYSAIISLNSINRFVFVMKMECVFWAVETDSINVIQINFVLKIWCAEKR